jgi:CubicO group peptidase (beta-lactamase class C family)
VPGVDALAAIDSWDVADAAAAVVRADGRVVATYGAGERAFALASVTKLLTTMAVLVAVEEGSVALDEPAGPPGATVRHLLAHAAGYGFDGLEPIAKPGVRRIYSNTGIEVLAEHVAVRSGMAFATYLSEAVLQPLGMRGCSLRGSPAHRARGTIDDLGRFAAELMAPTLIDAATLAEATSVQFAGLGGVLPGVGRFRPLDWGLGFELRDGKVPHWTGTTNGPRTFGHFGGSGTFLWVDPDAGAACVVLTDREFGPWALDAWPRLSDAVLAELATTR